LPDSLRPGFDLGGRFTLAAAAIAALPVGAYSKSKSALHSRAYHTSRRNDIEDGEKRRVAEWCAPDATRCGTVVVVLSDDVKRGKTVSCGCWKRQATAERRRAMREAKEQRARTGDTIGQRRP
jgi:hypothetical protein